MGSRNVPVPGWQLRFLMSKFLKPHSVSGKPINSNGQYQIITKRCLSNSCWQSSPFMKTEVKTALLHHCYATRNLSYSGIQRQNLHESDGAQQETSRADKRIDFEDPDKLLKQQEQEEQEYEHSIKQRILKSALNHVNEYGWTKKTLEAGAVSEGLPPVSHGMFPNGGVELINFFYMEKNAELGRILSQQIEKAKQDGLGKPNTKQFIRDAIEIRLRMIVPYLDTWPKAMAIQTLPQNAPTAWSNLLNIADEIWYHAGDRSTDFNWYTKRLSVAGIYKTSEIFMLQDKSLDLQDTMAFVDRRLDEVVALGSSKQTMEKTSNALKECLKGVAIMGRNITGMNSRNR